MIPLETDEQQVVVQYLELKGLKFSSIPNSTYTKSWKQKAKNKAEGLRAGLPDLLIVLPNLLLFIEMKRTKGGVVSPVQKEWIEELNKIDGVKAIVCKGADEAIENIETLLKNLKLIKPYKTK